VTHRARVFFHLAQTKITGVVFPPGYDLSDGNRRAAVPLWEYAQAVGYARAVVFDGVELSGKLVNAGGVRADVAPE